MRVDSPPAHGGAGAPYLAEQLHSRRDRSPPSHQRKEEPEFRSSHPYRLTSPQYCLGGGLQEYAAEADRSSQPRGGTCGKTPRSTEQLFHSRNQLAHDRSVRVSGAIQLIGAS
jgi:hypothetical protein